MQDISLAFVGRVLIQQAEDSLCTLDGKVRKYPWFYFYDVLIMF